MGLLAGVRAATVHMGVAILLVVAGLVVLAVLAPDGLRPVFLCLAAGCSAGWAMAEIRSPDADPDVWVTDSILLVGTVVSDPRTTVRGSQVRVLWEDSSHYRRESMVLVPPAVDFGRGDIIRAHGAMSRDSNPPAFFATSVIVERPASKIEIARRSIRKHVSQRMVASVPGSPGSLVLGLLIGDDSGLARSERSELRISGLSHITAVSGWNVSVVVVSVGALFRALGGRGWRWLSVQIVMLFAYVWIVGLEPPIQRAAIMGTVALIALQLGRPSHMLTLLTLTAGVMAAWNPDVLNSLSFLLSFLAMVGLTVAARVTYGITGMRAAILTPALAACLAALATAPVIAATFGTVSLMTVPANVVAAPLVPLATFSGMFVVASSWFWPLAESSGWIAWILSSGILWMSGQISGIPGAHLSFEPLQPSTVFTIYLGLAFLAAPCLPEGRALLRKSDAWLRTEPRLAILTLLVVLGILAVGVLTA